MILAVRWHAWHCSYSPRRSFRAVAGRWFCTSARGKSVFSRHISFTSTVERMGQAVRGDGYFAAGYGAFPAALVMEGRLLAIEREGAGASTPASSILPFSYSPRNPSRRHGSPHRRQCYSSSSRRDGGGGQ
jgi:hypothetical protein